MWRRGAQINGAAGVLELLAGFYHSKERLVVWSFRVAASENWNTGGWTWGSQRTWALELVQEANPCQNYQTWKNSIIYHPRVTHIQMGTDKIAAQAARSWMGAIISPVMWKPKQHNFSSGSSRAEVAACINAINECINAINEYINAHVKPVRWNSWRYKATLEKSSGKTK